MIYKTREFQALFKKARLSDRDLMTACDEMTSGLIEADLGNHLYKQRIAVSGQGKRGGYRTLIGAVIGERYFFVYLFAKNNRSNITRREQSALKELANVLVGFNQDEIDHLIATGELIKLEKNDE